MRKVLLGLLLGVIVAVAMAQTAGFVAGAASGMTRRYAVPAYLKSCHYSGTTAYNLCHGGATVLGCVVINNAGAAGSQILLYNAYSVQSGYLLATIDGTKVGSQFCYGNIYSGALGVAVTSSGASPDATITYQGQ